ncbi:uncharacterized protein K452DRAFT_336122 [Aplosporella prunicola CBS 121167]|uniref:Uncharacterized protein n=1 Tax=Aplosporella prunicola CBS 121167 TaxID=1176127 RepID=A0A6A6AT60_9PEZI|nr:uncharacterized protein K452DRAFT_336122 [Aplosporella prunicola CBS 121167]KAF2135149.1 hypothetical protein K452DRAFT_336122 [Aplosporella prunicola CBS 121167]
MDSDSDSDSDNPDGPKDMPNVSNTSASGATLPSDGLPRDAQGYLIVDPNNPPPFPTYPRQTRLLSGLFDRQIWDKPLPVRPDLNLEEVFRYDDELEERLKSIPMPSPSPPPPSPAPERVIKKMRVSEPGPNLDDNTQIGGFEGDEDVDEKGAGEGTSTFGKGAIIPGPNGDTEEEMGKTHLRLFNNALKKVTAKNQGIQRKNQWLSATKEVCLQSYLAKQPNMTITEKNRACHRYVINHQLCVTHKNRKDVALPLEDGIRAPKESSDNVAFWIEPKA